MKFGLRGLGLRSLGRKRASISVNPLTVLFAATLLSLMFCPSSLSAGVLGKPGTSATYKLAADISERPEYERTNKLSVVSAQVQLGPEVKLADKSMAQWASLSFTRLNGQKYRMWILMNSWPNGKGEPKVSRYLWHESQWTDALEFVHETKGTPVLPRISLWEYGWPRTASGDKPISLNSGFTKEIQFQGWPFKLDKVEKGAAFVMPKKVTPVKINPDVLIATYNRYQDVEGRHRLNIGKEQYTYIDTKEDEWKKHFDAGFNMHIGETTADWVNRSGVYRVHWYHPPYITDWPAQLYRSNFWGRGVLVDEPAVHYRGWADQNASGTLNPADSARDLEKWAVKHIWEESGLYSAYELGIVLKKTFGLGNLKIIERKYFTWEAFWDSAWYEMAPKDTTSGIVDEDINPEVMVEKYNMAYGTQIPPTIENACALKTAVVRGACRNFNKNWGTSIYSYNPNQLEPKRNQTTLRWMYNAGSTYFWFWNCWPGLSDAHVPYPYQRAYANTIRQAYKENPNRDMKALLNVAKVCIVLPYGYTFNHDRMQSTKWLYLDRKASTGLTFRQILTNAAVEVERCIRSGIVFDFAIDEPRFKPKGYEELIYIREDGSVKIVRPGRGEQVLSQGRNSSRPDLGPMPQISIRVDQVPASGPGMVKMTALPTPGAGEMALDIPRIGLYRWEAFVTDDAGNMKDLIGSDTDTFSFEAKLDGNYRVRVAASDVFGRPAVAETTFKVSKAN